MKNKIQIIIYYKKYILKRKIHLKISSYLIFIQRQILLECKKYIDLICANIINTKIKFIKNDQVL